MKDETMDGNSRNFNFCVLAFLIGFGFCFHVNKREIKKGG